MFSFNFAVALEIRVNRQKLFTIINFQKRQILVFLLSLLTGGCLDCEFYPQTIWGNHFYSGMVCMAKYYLPEGMRYATLNEREEFYTAEFNLAKVAEWFGERMSNVKFAVIMGRHTQIYREKYRKDADTTIIIDEYHGLNDVRDQILEFLPESAYYDRNVYDANNRKTGQELAFDLDPENITCPIHGSLADKMKRHQGLSFCTIELQMVKEQAINLYEYLEKQFSHMCLVYSGRGFHIHVFDPDAYALSDAERRKLARTVKAKGFGIDEWVTVGEMRLIRLPYSLHGLVSRIVLPLKKSELERFNPVSDVRCIPKFLGEAVTS
jgi:DNA primase catalytic subunit